MILKELPYLRATQDEEVVINLDFLISVSGIMTAEHEGSKLWDFAVVTMSNGDRYFISTEAREDLIDKLNQLDNGYGDL